MHRTILVLLMFVTGFAPLLQGETRRLSRVYYQGRGTGDATVVAGIDAAAGVLEKWLELEARKDLARVYAAHPGFEFAYPKSGTRPLPRPLSQRRLAEVPPAIPFGFWEGTILHSPWSNMTFQGEQLWVGDLLFDPITGLLFRVPDPRLRDTALSTSP
jgi:hypothetical protein